MSAYPWLQHDKRYRSFRYTFRYLFPNLAAVWIQWQRLVLRIRWFFSYSVDEFLAALRDALLWPWYQLEHVGRGITGAVHWSVLSIYEFFRDLFRGVDWTLHWLGRLPVWTGASLAGVLGIMLTLLLFLIPPLPSPPLVASISATSVQEAAPKPQPVFEPIWPSHPEPTGPAEEEFDIFAVPDAPSRSIWPDDTRSLPSRSYGQPHLVTEFSRLSLPLNRHQRISVASRPLAVLQRDRWNSFDRSAARDGWGPRRTDRSRPAQRFSPYASRLDPRLKQRTPNWISPAAEVSPESLLASRRQPAVVVEKFAPATAAAGQPLQYALVVTNLSKERLESVTVRERISAMERVSNVHPSANVVGNELVWEVAELRPGEHRRLQVELLPDERRALTQTTTVAVTTGVAAVSDARQPRSAPQPADLDAELPPGPDAQPSPQLVLPGDDPAPSAPPAPGAGPSEQFFPDAEPSGNAAEPQMFPWESDSSSVPPPQEEPPFGGSVVLPPDTLLPERPASAEPSSGDERDELENPFRDHRQPPAGKEQPKAPSGSYEAYEPGPAEPADTLALQMLTPETVVAGSQVRTIFELHNRGKTDLHDIVLRVELSQALDHNKGRILELRLDRLAAGETYRTRLTTRAVRDGKALMVSKVTSPGTRQQTAQREIRINRLAAPSTNIALDIPRIYCPIPPCSPWHF